MDFQELKTSVTLMRLKGRKKLHKGVINIILQKLFDIYRSWKLKVDRSFCIII